MSRSRRVLVPGYPHHILHRGHSERKVFMSHEDFSTAINKLDQLRQQYKVRLYAWCLLPTRIHLLVNPRTDANSLSEFMREFSSAVTRSRNSQDGTSGTVWDSRFHASPVQPERWILAVQKYIEVLPLLYGHASFLEEYPWSSYQRRMDLNAQSWLDKPPEYFALGVSEAQRRASYQCYLQEEMPDDEKCQIETAIRRNQLTGDEKFRDDVELLTGIKVSNRGPGRPPKDPKEEDE